MANFKAWWKKNQHTVVYKNQFLIDNPWVAPLWLIAFVSIITWVLIIVKYVVVFMNNGFSIKVENWAQFGDFIGGISSAVLGLLNLCVTIAIAIFLRKWNQQEAERRLTADTLLHDKQIKEQKEIVKFQLKYEAVKELKKTVQTQIDVWSVDLENIALARKVSVELYDFSDNYQYLFMPEAIVENKRTRDFIFNYLQAVQEGRKAMTEHFHRHTAYNIFKLIGNLNRYIIE